jgi:hypothetical protein
MTIYIALITIGSLAVLFLIWAEFRHARRADQELLEELDQAIDAARGRR